MRNRFAAIASEASYVAYRCAHTTFVKEVQDYQVAAAGLTGEFFAWPTESGSSMGVCQSVKGLVESIGEKNLSEGDVIICNDPYSSGADVDSGGAIVTHMMDIHLLMPIFYKGTLVSYAWAFVHASDIGGSVPGSINPTNSEIFQEGLRITPAHLYRKGEFNAQLWQFFKDNTRIPDLIWGDLQAMLAGMKLLDARIKEICDRNSAEVLLESIEDVLELAAQKGSKALSTLKNGTYRSHAYLEAYDEGGHIFINCKMIVEDGNVTLDFTGSDPQVQYAMNFPSSQGRAHSHLCYALVQYIRTIERTAPINGGMVRSIRNIAQKGSIVNAEFPAAGGNRAITVNRCYEAVLGCMNQAIEGGLAAAGAGIVGVLSVSSLNPKTALRHVSVVEPFLGGGGGRKGLDGVDGVHLGAAFLKSVPVEVVELETQLVIRRFGYETDSAAPGEFRGGASLRLDLQNTKTPAMIACRGLDRFRFHPWGANGGACGRRAEVTLNPDTPSERNIGKIEVLSLQPGDVLRLISPSGGGFGDPMKRTVERVIADVRDGILSKEAALREYGVSIEGSGMSIRGQRVSHGADAESIGKAQVELEATWPPEVSAAFAVLILKQAPGVRRYWMDQIRNTLNTKGRKLTIEDLTLELDRLRDAAV
jgi:N-methylhydantoinase B